MNSATNANGVSESEPLPKQCAIGESSTTKDADNSDTIKTTTTGSPIGGAEYSDNLTHFLPTPLQGAQLVIQRRHASATLVRTEEPRICQVAGFALPDTSDSAGPFFCCVLLPGETPPNLLPIGYCAGACVGHATAVHAMLHYRQFLLDKQLALDTPARVCRNCLVCGTRTHRAAAIWTEFHDAWVFPLCDFHRTRARVRQLFVLEEFTSATWTKIESTQPASLGKQPRPSDANPNSSAARPCRPLGREGAEL